MTRQSAQARGARALALWLLAFGFIGAALTGLTALGWLRGTLRFGCSWAVGGTEAPDAAGGSWWCGDGIVLLLPGAALMVLAGIALLVTTLLVLAVWDRVRERAGVLAAGAAVLAAAPTVVTCLALLRDASVHDNWSAELIATGAESRLALWGMFALPALAVTVAAAALAAAGLWLRTRGRGRRIAAALVLVALALLLVSAVLSALGTLSHGIVAASIIGACWQLASAAAPAVEQAEQKISAAMSIEGVPDRRLE